MKALDLVTKNVATLKTSDTGARALRLMHDFHVSHLPIVNENQLLGLISEEDILNAHGEEDPIGSLPLSFMRPFIHDYEHLFEVLKVSTEFRLSVVPVIDKEENYIGLITKDDLLNYFAIQTDILEPGGIIVLEISVHDYLLSDIARIIESNHARILCTFAGTNYDSTKMELTIKVNQTELQPIISDLNRFNYVVKETFQEAEYFDNLKERYDSLMNYLNI
ncbi:MAG: CBS domain-containing protein [Chitinophagales bacterium]|jgi:CBS domain-containing protein|nr:CBS domain-containing protein [Chitinophagales bacterium]